MADLSYPFISVIIPVFNNAQGLQLCLEALDNQTYPQDRYEVIVVDNGSDPAQDIQGVVARFQQAIATSESTPTSYAARNKGVSLTRGTVIAFTDADCIPAADWLETGARYLMQTPQYGFVAGKVELFFDNPQRLTPVELYEKILAFPQQDFVNKFQFGATANLLTHQEVLAKVGGFDDRLKSWGDVEWGQRVAALGYPQVYAEDVCVAHPARTSFGQLYRKARRSAGGKHDLEHRLVERSDWKHSHLITSLIKGLIPPRKPILEIFSDPRLSGLKQKLTVSFVFLFVHYVIALERLRLLWGGTSIRD
jgi:glycosyltransferase involved in cell wall biosynthesis